jgi:hypothetical protein
VDIKVYQQETGTKEPSMIVESTSMIEFLPISLWFDAKTNHYSCLKDAPMMDLNSQSEESKFVDHAPVGDPC